MIVIFVGRDCGVAVNAGGLNATPSSRVNRQAPPVHMTKLIATQDKGAIDAGTGLRGGGFPSD
jgi:hypothetical protein